MKIKIFKRLMPVIICALFIMAIGVCLSNADPRDLQSRTLELKSYTRSRGYNADYGVLVDYRRHSFQRRLYVVDLNSGDVVMRSFCGHGRGGKSNILKGEFSNVSGSNCSSLGHYKIGRERNMYNYPVKAFELDGLDKTNSNARPRSILIHPSVGPRSLGCVTLPFLKYRKLSRLLHLQYGEVIMWAYR